MLKKLNKAIMAICIMIMITSATAYTSVGESYTFYDLDTAEQYIIYKLESLDSEIKFNLAGEGLIRSIREPAATRTLSDVFLSAIEKVQYVRYNHSKASHSYSGTIENIAVIINIEHYNTPKEEAYLRQAVSNIIGSIISDDMTVIAKIRAINDYIVLNTEYSTNTIGSEYSAYTVLTEGKGVCNGYAVLAHLMLEEIGIENKLISGNVGSELHLWNLVKIKDEWFHLDVTWNDPLRSEPVYTYFLKNDDFMRKTHAWDYGKYPAATNSSYAHIAHYWEEIQPGAKGVIPFEERLFIRDHSYSDWAELDIKKAIENNIVTPHILSNFKSDITREEFAELLILVYEQLGGAEPVITEKNRFIDTQSIPIMKANALGITSGVGNGKFNPHGKISRQQLAVMSEGLLNALEISPIVTMEYRFFADEVEIADYAKNSIQLMNKLGIMTGVGNQRIDPRGNVPRQQAIAVLARLFELYND